MVIMTRFTLPLLSLLLRIPNTVSQSSYLESIFDKLSATAEPSFSPSSSPTHVPSISPTSSPSNFPSISPTSSPSNFPTMRPTSSPSNFPSMHPTLLPSQLPSVHPSSLPSHLPTTSPTNTPTNAPTDSPSTLPSIIPTVTSSETPTLSHSSIPSSIRSSAPSPSAILLPKLEMPPSSNTSKDAPNPLPAAAATSQIVTILVACLGSAIIVGGAFFMAVKYMMRSDSNTSRLEQPHSFMADVFSQNHGSIQTERTSVWKRRINEDVKSDTGSRCDLEQDDEHSTEGSDYFEPSVFNGSTIKSEGTWIRRANTTDLQSRITGLQTVDLENDIHTPIPGQIIVNESRSKASHDE